MRFPETKIDAATERLMAEALALDLGCFFDGIGEWALGPST